MLPTPELQACHYYYDTEGNGIDRRVLPNGREFEVIKNYPKPEELLKVLRGRARDINYEEDKALQRWMLTYKCLGFQVI